MLSNPTGRDDDIGDQSDSNPHPINSYNSVGTIKKVHIMDVYGMKTKPKID